MTVHTFGLHTRELHVNYATEAFLLVSFSVSTKHAVQKGTKTYRKETCPQFPAIDYGRTVQAHGPAREGLDLLCNRRINKTRRFFPCFIL